jgi:hypothetical protein
MSSWLLYVPIRYKEECIILQEKNIYLFAMLTGYYEINIEPISEVFDWTTWK